MLLTVKEVLLFFGRGYGGLFLLIDGAVYIHLFRDYYLNYIMAVLGISDLYVSALFRDIP